MTWRSSVMLAMLGFILFPGTEPPGNNCAKSLRDIAAWTIKPTGNVNCNSAALTLSKDYHG